MGIEIMEFFRCSPLDFSVSNRQIGDFSKKGLFNDIIGNKKKPITEKLTPKNLLRSRNLTPLKLKRNVFSKLTFKTLNDK
jgi:hypothetical protein